MQHFRAKFDLGAEPDLYEFGQRDIYSVSSLLKQYFRQLPNPLFTFQAYSNILVWHFFIILYHQAFFQKAFDAPAEDRSSQLRHEIEFMPAEHFQSVDLQ